MNKKDWLVYQIPWILEESGTRKRSTPWVPAHTFIGMFRLP